MARLSRKTALITGATSPLGQAIARAYAAAGADLILHYTRQDEAAAASALSRELVPQGRRTVLIQCDVATAEGAYTAVETAIAGFGGIDILVNTVGVPLGPLPLADLPLMRFTGLMQAAMAPVLLLTRLLLPQMTTHNYGRIIATAPGDDRGASDGADAIAGAIRGYIGSLARSLAPRDLAANCVAPHLLTGGDLTDVAAAYVFLAQDEARSLVGECLSPRPRGA